jgi:hypothetical protein
MKSSKCSFLLIISALFISFSINAKKFTSQYSEFELPPGWECSLEGTEWVCQSTNKARQKEAIIILAAKIRGEKDSLDEYQSYLKKNKTFKLPGGKTQVSEPKYAIMKTINNHRWIDALHLASEVPGFYTRYVATVKEDLGVAVTLSVSKDHYTAYQPVFDKIVASLRVFREKQEVSDKFKLKKEEEDLLGDTSFVEGGESKFGRMAAQKKEDGGAGSVSTGTSIIVIIGIAVVAVIGFMVSQKKKKGSDK